MNDLDFTGKSVLVVGGSSGIGNAIAQSFRARGADVHVWGTRANSSDYSADDGSDLTGLHYSQMDASNLEAIEAFEPTFAQLDVLVLSQGIVLYGLLVPRLQQSRDPEMLSIILFFGLSQVIEALVTIAFGTSERSIPSRELGSLMTSAAKAFGAKPEGGPVDIFGQAFPAAWVISAAVSVIAIALVYVYLYRTRLGTLTRAVMSRRDEAFATGINVDRVCAAAFGIGLGLAAIAGVFAPFMFGSVTPAFGADATVTAFVIVVLGSLGNPLGTALGGIVYGICYMLVQTFLSSWADLL
ncbi:MAG: SDR family NAD(P)-dependent oxidoreductase, partial [Rhizobiales bacterium]|nr:SDR family NAD(P)-dependent oxidoreductase [Hyphomicrobiales bacterium]